MTRATFRPATLIAGKHVRKSHNWLSFHCWLTEAGASFSLSPFIMKMKASMKEEEVSYRCCQVREIRHQRCSFQKGLFCSPT